MHHATRRRRAHVVTLRLSEHERERLYRGAALLGVSGSALLREALVVRLVDLERETLGQARAGGRHDRAPAGR
jgi:hypothetical protein